MAAEPAIEPTSALSGMPSIRCSLEVSDVPKLVDLYKPLLLETVSGMELLSHLNEVIDSRGRQQVRQIFKNEGPIASMEHLLCLLEESLHSEKWVKFVQALERNDYIYVAQALKGGEVPRDVYCKYRKLLKSREVKLIKELLDPKDLVEELKERDVINQRDREEIERERANCGNIAATTVLLDKIWRRNPKWYHEFLEVLCENGQCEVVKGIEQEFVEEWKKRNQPNDSLSSSTHSSVSTQEDYLSVRSGNPENLCLASNNELDSPLTLKCSQLEVESIYGSEPPEDPDDEITYLKSIARSSMVNSNELPGDLNSFHDCERRASNTLISNMSQHDRSYMSDTTNSWRETRTENNSGPTSSDTANSWRATPNDNYSGPTSSLVGRLLNSIDNSVANHIARDGGIQHNIMGPDYDEKSVDQNDTDSSDDEAREPKKPLQLRSYQEELAEAALNDKNCIIVAPTGSGKTHVAMKIIQHHRESRRRLHIPKVVFLVEQSALAEQQGKVCKEFLACKVKVITGETQRTESFQNLSTWLQKKDILVITAQILVNALATEDVTIENFSLMIFDECHHSHAKHPYNQIMAHYLDLKLEGRDRQLPQIVGMTASVGVGKAKNNAKAVEWIETMMANMDAEVLCTVQRNKVELAEHVNHPEQDVVKTPSRKKNDFGRIIQKIMTATEKFMIQSPCAKDIEDRSILKPPAESGNDQYTQWLSRLWKEEAKVENEKSRRFIHTCRVYLDMYNKALIIYADARASDSLTFIKEELKKWEEHLKPDETDTKMKSLFEKSQDLLRRCSEDRDHDNPKLLELRTLIIRAYRQDYDSRGIIFVRTRDLVKAIHRWMMETEGLRQLNPVIFTGAQAASSAGGMTKVQQVDALRFFKEGIHKLVIATSVAEEGLDIQKCNLVIRYDYVSNEIAMVQARGRGRAENSKYYVVAAQGGSTADREELNMMREAMMNQAIETLQQRFRNNRRTCLENILFLQKKAKTERDLAAKSKDGHVVRQGQYVLRCQKCSKYICMSTEVRKIQNAHHACVCDDIKGRVIGKKLPRPQFQDDDLQCAVGKLLCKECGSDVGNVSIYKNAQFPILRISGLLLEDNMGRRDVKKKWKDVPFEVPQITADDILRRSKADKLIDMI